VHHGNDAHQLPTDGERCGDGYSYKNNTCWPDAEITSEGASDSQDSETEQVDASLGKDLPFKEKDMKHGQRILIKLWNTARFVEMSSKPGKQPQLEMIDRWILSRLSQTLSEYLRNFDHYNFSKSRHLVEQFFLKEFCQYLQSHQRT